MNTMEPIRLTEITKGQIMAMWVTCRTSTKGEITIKDDSDNIYAKFEKKYGNTIPNASNEQKGTHGICDLGECFLGFEFATYKGGENLRVEFLVENTGEPLRLCPDSPKVRPINFPNGAGGVVYKIEVEDWTDEDYNDYVVTIVAVDPELFSTGTPCIGTPCVETCKNSCCLYPHEPHIKGMIDDKLKLNNAGLDAEIGNWLNRNVPTLETLMDNWWNKRDTDDDKPDLDEAIGSWLNRNIPTLETFMDNWWNKRKPEICPPKEEPDFNAMADEWFESRMTGYLAGVQETTFRALIERAIDNAVQTQVREFVDGWFRGKVNGWLRYYTPEKYPEKKVYPEAAKEWAIRSGVMTKQNGPSTSNTPEKEECKACKGGGDIWLEHIVRQDVAQAVLNLVRNVLGEE
ncbi:MAG: hypothetical protein FWG83_02345 [Oscillospiraceae bacterium]|nr:hypothetical protein [Oscillospiraceae bacterium]